MEKKSLTKPVISIVTVNLNNADGLDSTLQSIVDQESKNYELIVIDGKSTDNSIDVINKFSQNINYWVSEIDNGIYSAMNKGIVKSQGEYCFFLNSGDRFADKSVLSNLINTELKADVIYGNLLVVSGGNPTGYIKGKTKLTFLDIYSSFLKHQASFIRRDLFDRYGLYDETIKISADWAFFLKTVGFNGASVKYENIDIALFDDNGISHNNPEICILESKIILDKFIPKSMHEDFRLLKKYQGIRYIDQSRTGWFLFRCMVKIFKLLSVK